MKKRILALVLSVAMVLGAVSFTAFADAPANPYDSGKNDTATYLMKVPADTAGLAGMYSVTDDIQLTVRQENGENFIVFDESIFGTKPILASVNIPKLTYGVEKGIPAEVDLTNLNSMYYAIRFKVNDNSPAYTHTGSNFNINFTFNDPSVEEVEYQDYIITPTSIVNKGAPLKWLSLKDGSITGFHSQHGQGDDGIEVTGDVDGWILIPANHAGFEKEPVLKADELRTLFTGLQFDFAHGTTTASGVAVANKGEGNATWDNKEVLIGDVMLVSDKDTFAKAHSEKYGVAGKMYAPNNGDDTAYHAARIGELRHMYYGYNGAKGTGVGKKYIPTDATTSTSRQYLHTVLLSNGDRAVEGTVNEGYAERTDGKFNNISIHAIDTYEDSYSLDTSGSCMYNGAPGIPTQYIDLAKINYLSFRVATRGIADGETAVINYGLYPQGASATSLIPAGTVVKFIDVATGAKTEYTVGETGITLNKDIDGWFLVEKSAFACMANEDIATTWGNTGNNYGISLRMVSGFAVGEAAYLGDTYFVEDADKFHQYHCTHANKAAGEVVAPTCKEKGYTPVTCPDCGLVEKTAETDIVSCNQDIPVPAQAPTCEEPGFSAGARCSWCNEISLATNRQEPIGHDMKAGEVVAPKCEVEGYTVYTCANGCGKTENKDVTTATGHNMTAGEVVAPKCEADGYTVYTCANGCGKTENKDVTTATGHNMTAGEVVAPTCKAEGHTVYTCANGCGKTENKDVTEKLAHDLEKVETVAPTATEKGYDVLDCKDCDYTEKGNYVDELGEEEKEEEENKSPETGDNNIFAVVMMIVALGAATVLFATKKRANR